MSPKYLHARQTPQALPTALMQPTTTIALSTTFTPSSPCTYTSQINILPPPGYLLWWNEPVPYTSMTIKSCYPSEFLRSYTSVAPTSDRALGSSIVPPMSPLVCPENFCTQYVGSNNYIACCPSGYKFATTGAPIVSNRPAYGGICYTDIQISQELTALVYDSTGSTHTEIWAPSTTGAQGYAHPIDGWAKTSPVLGCPTRSPTSTKSRTSFALPSSRGPWADNPTEIGTGKTTKVKTKGKRRSAGTIAGIVFGVLTVVAAIIGFAVAMSKRKKNAQKDGDAAQQLMGDEGKAQEVEGDQIYQKGEDQTRGELQAAPATSELGTGNHDAANASELGTEPVSELPARNH